MKTRLHARIQSTREDEIRAGVCLGQAARLLHRREVDSHQDDGPIVTRIRLGCSTSEWKLLGRGRNAARVSQ